MKTISLPWSWFTGVKYVVYAWLVLNLGLFLAEDTGSWRHLNAAGLTPMETVGVFAQTLDTAAWVILLLLFELETSILSDDRLTRRTEYILHAARFCCAGLIVYAFTGYLTKAAGLLAFVPVGGADACSLGDGFSAMVRLDGYEAILPANCAAFAGALLALPGTTVVATLADHAFTSRLAWLDVINAGAWIAVVAMLEIDVRITEHHRRARRWRNASRWLKALLYGVLFIAALLWGLAGTWLDFFDASLWLVAFFCIELNVFAWARQVSPGRETTAGLAAG